jgi:hypothetical protein
MTFDIFGDVIDVGTIERAFVATLKAWLPSHLARQEARLGMETATLPFPRSWPTVSDFDIEVEEQLPAVIVISPGSDANPTRDQTGAYRMTWRFEVAIAIAGRDEYEARNLAGVYLAAIRSALVQNPTLGGVAENTRPVGPDDHAVGQTERGSQRAIYGTSFAVDVRDVVTDTAGPVEPPDDPYHPGEPAASPLEADIEVTLEASTP